MHRLRTTPLTLACRGLCNLPHPANYFKLLGVHERFRVDAADLSARFKKLQREWHPDKHASSDDASAQTSAADMSALLNQAYAALRSPHSRASHLLQVLGVDTDGVGLDPAFLTWVVECRERIADADAGSEEADKLAEEVTVSTDRCLRAMDMAFEEKRFQDAVALTHKLRYLQRMGVAIEELS